MQQSVRASHIEDQYLEARRRVDEQQVKLDHMIVRGAPTQAAEDHLRKLKIALDLMKRRMTD